MIHCFVTLINSRELTDNKNKRTYAGKRRVKRAKIWNRKCYGEM